MKHLFLTLVLAISFAYGVHAQTCSITLCTEVVKNERGNTDLLNVFGGFGDGAIGQENNFKIYVRFQDYSLNVSHTFYIVLLNPSGTVHLEGKKSNFSFIGPERSLAHTGNWGVTFDTAGIYKVVVYVDGKVASYLNVSVGD